MSDHDKDELPVYDRATSKFLWLKNPPPTPAKPERLTYGSEVADEDGNPMPLVSNGVRVGQFGKRASEYFGFIGENFDTRIKFA